MSISVFVKCQSSIYEDWKIALAYFQKNSYMISFDLKSGYHHIDIFEGHQFLLGFSWRFPGSSVSRFFVFTVLPFGLSVASFTFTKCLKPLEKYWRLQGIKIAIFLDDGWITENAFHACKDVSTMVRNDLSRTGFITNNSKSVWEPVQVLDWLGLRWNAIDATIHIIDRRLRAIFLDINRLITAEFLVSARTLASFVGKIISAGPVVGNISRIMTRHCAMSIAAAQDWDSPFPMNEYSVREVYFWKYNLSQANIRHCFDMVSANIFVYSDASASGCGGHVTLNQEHICHRMWNDEERRKSSTWRELAAIDFALQSFCPLLKNSSVKWFTDNQAAARIVESGSMRKDLHFLCFKVFQTCLLHKISLEIQWIPRSGVQRADYISRLIDTDDWKISTQFLSFLKDFGDLTHLIVSQIITTPNSLSFIPGSGTRDVQELIILYNLSVTKIAWLFHQSV